MELLHGIDERVRENGCLRKGDTSEIAPEIFDAASLHAIDDEFFDVESSSGEPPEGLLVSSELRIEE